MEKPTYSLQINNGNLRIGLSVKYYGHLFLKDKTNEAIVGKIQNPETGVYNYMLSYGCNVINYKNTDIKISNNILDKEITDDNVHSHLQNTEILIEVYGDKKSEEYKTLIKEFIDESIKYYEENIMEIDSEEGKVSIYFFDEYWELLTKRNPRKLNTIYLNGIENELKEYILKFKSKENKERYASLGIPYKKILC